MTGRFYTVGPAEKGMGDLIDDVNEAIARRRLEGLTHDDVIGATLNLLAHHAHRVRMPRAELHVLVDAAFDCHAARDLVHPRRR